MIPDSAPVAVADAPEMRPRGGAQAEVKSRQRGLPAHAPGAIIIGGLIVLTLFLYGRGFTRSVGCYGDAFHHLMNGIFVFDSLRYLPEAVSDPLEFAVRYYVRYPAVNLGYYPPVFACAESLMMAVFGVSGAAGQLTVLIFAVLMALFTYGWCVQHMEAWWAGAAAALTISCPLLVFWGRDIMLDIPMLSLTVGSVWLFERMIRHPRPSWGLCLSWCALTVAALWTKQYALMILGVFFVSVVATGAWRLLRHPAVLVSAIMVVLSAGALVLLTLRLGGTAVAYTIAPTHEHHLTRLRLEHWTFYPKVLPQVIGWPALLLSIVGLVVVLWRRHAYVSTILGWIVVFYGMHSYFKAQEVRYAALWVPPFCLLAVYGLRWVHQVTKPLLQTKRISVGGLAAVLLVSFTAVKGSQMPIPALPSGYQRAADLLADIMPPYNCLTFLPDRPGRLAVCYRLAVEERRGEERDIFSFGRIIRAEQVFPGWRAHWADAEAAGDTLDSWNVKYIVCENPRPIYVEERDPEEGDPEVSAMIDELIATGRYRPLRSYPIHLRGRREMADRTLTIYERVIDLPYRPEANPMIRTQRVPRVLSDSDDT